MAVFQDTLFQNSNIPTFQLERSPYFGLLDLLIFGDGIYPQKRIYTIIKDGWSMHENNMYISRLKYRF